MRIVNKSLKARSRNRERGMAIFLVLLALVLLSSIAVALTYSTSTESGINLNYRQEEIAYFAARTGVEELRDRMSVATGSAAPSSPITPPLNLPGQSTPNGYVLYLINQGTDPTTVQPWSTSNKYFDDELCHDGYNIGHGQGQGNNTWPNSLTSPGVRCTDLPSVSGWYQTVSGGSTLQWNGTAAAVPFKWARVAMKANGSVMYGDPGQSGTQNYYSVNSSISASQPVCYDGVSERALPTSVTGTATLDPCSNWANAATPVYADPVYVITAMGVSPSGARKVVQEELALPPSPPFPYGLFAKGTGCGSLTFSGNGATDSYNSQNGAYGGANVGSAGDIGSFGNISLGGNASVGGQVGVTGTGSTPVNAGTVCAGYGVTYSGANVTADGCSVNGSSGSCPTAQNPWELALPANITPALFPTPPQPTPTPPTTTTTYTTNTTLPPGTYGNINVTGGTLTLQPGVYNINSISASGGHTNITVSPVGQVILNIQGAGGTAFSFAGQSLTNASGVPYDFLVNYWGTDTITLAGQNGTYATVNAPNAAINVSGQGDTFGAVIGNTISYTGQGHFHFDRNSAFRPRTNQNFVMLSFRELSY